MARARVSKEQPVWQTVPPSPRGSLGREEGPWPAQPLSAANSHYLPIAHSGRKPIQLPSLPMVCLEGLMFVQLHTIGFSH